MAVVLHYVGDGSTWFPGAPLRDLDGEEVAAAGLDIEALVKSGLYVRPDAKAAAGAPANKAAHPAVENKEQ